MRHRSQYDGFRFRYVVDGETLGLRAREGTLDDEALNLAGMLIPYAHIVDTTSRGNRLILEFSQEFYYPEGEFAQCVIDGRLVVMEVRKGTARGVEMAVDRKCADAEAKARRAQLQAQGLHHLVRTEDCPSCGATIDLSGLDPTPYAHCRYCETIFSRDRMHIAAGAEYRICDECGLYDRVQEYPEFYFYFLLVVYGFRYNHPILCDGCAHRLFIKALVRNAIFLVGVPTAIWVKLKSLRARDPEYAGLTRANQLARKGRHRDAAVFYDELLRRLPEHPAILMNQAIGHGVGDDGSGAAALLDRSLAACNHYLPALRLLEAVAEPEAAVDA